MWVSKRKFQNYISELRKDISNLEGRIGRLENPPKFKILDKVMWDYLIKWNKDKEGTRHSGSGIIIAIKYFHSSSSMVHYGIWDGIKIQEIQECFLNYDDLHTL